MWSAGGVRIAAPQRSPAPGLPVHRHRVWVTPRDGKRPGFGGGRRSRVWLRRSPISGQGRPACKSLGMDQRLSLVTLGVADVVRARNFYEALGWSGESPDGEVVFFQAGGMIVALWDRGKLAEDSGVADNGGWGGVALGYCADSPATVDTLLAQAQAAGAVITRPAAQAFWGGYSGYFSDPDGFLWEVAWNPGFAIAEDGSIRIPD